MKILLDNGHGRETAGKRSPDGRLLEWAYTREIFRRVNAELQQRGFYSSLLVPKDEDIPLAERCCRVNRVCSELGRRNVCLVSGRCMQIILSGDAITCGIASKNEDSANYNQSKSWSNVAWDWKSS